MRRLPLLSLILFAAYFTAFSQGEIPVDMYTGQPSITVPIWSVTSGDVSQPIVLSYNASGASKNTPMGRGWNISTGSITREVRNYPDDVGYNLPVRGWFYKNPSNVIIGTDVGNFVPAADNTTAWESGEGTDHLKIKTWANESGSSYAMDTEPDIFHYSAGGISGSFVFDNDLTYRTIPYADVVITPTYVSSTDRRITSFTIATNDGYLYTFNHSVTSNRTTTEQLYGNNNYYLPSEARLYNTTVSYTSEWKLTRIDSPNGAYITLAYTNSSDNQSTNGEIGQYQYPDPFYANPSDIIQNTAYVTGRTTGTARVSLITGSTGSKAEFNYSGTPSTLQTIIISDDRRGSTTSERKIKTFTLEYLMVTNTYDSYGFYPAESEPFLSSVTQSSGCEILPPYKFTYTHVFTQSYQTPNPGTYIFAWKGSDEWGNPNDVSNEYPFPKLYIYPDEPMIDRYRTHKIPAPPDEEYIVPGAQRTSTGDRKGVLSSITTPEGGVTEFSFEGNEYLDPRTGLSLPCGGLRIKKISYYDGFNQTPIVKTFEYVDPETGKSSGRIIRKPSMAVPSIKWKSPSGSSYDKTFTTPELSTEEKYQYLLIRRESDLTQGETTQGSSVGYKIVTVRRPGAGYARFEYLMPATYGDGATGDWAPTVNKFARSTSSSYPNMGVIDGSNTWGFPFTPNPNYDFERGLISKKTDYTSNDKVVQQTITTYQRLYKTGSTPEKVWGLRYDRYPGSNPNDKIYFYGRYYLLTDAISVPAKEVTTRYDLADGTGNTKLKDSVEYLYEGTAHRLLTQVKRYTSDGNLYTTRLKYPKDYTTYTSGEADAVAIHTMKSNNRHSMPIETVQTFKKAGNDSIWVVGGTVIKLDPFGGSTIRLRSIWNLKASPPIYWNNFSHSTIVNSSGYKFRIDSRYERVDSIMSYTSLGDVKVSRNPFSRKATVKGYGYSSTIPVVQLANVQLNNVTDIQGAFSDFETATGFEFATSTSYYGTGRTGLKAFYAREFLSKNINRAPVVSNYILSFWVKSNTSFNLTVALKPVSGGTAYSTATVNVPNTSSEYKYIRSVIPLTNVPAAPSQFKVELNAPSLPAPPANNPPAGGLSSSLVNVLDDVFFYPENAEMVATTYTIPFGAASVTAGSGSASHTDYDRLGRPKIVYDKDKNIVTRQVYQYSAQSPLTADFTINGMTVGVASVFTAVTNDCVTDATYEWDWGTGFQPGTAVLNHTFQALGVYTVSMRVTSIAYGTKTVSKTFTIVNSPFNIEMCARGAVYYINNVPDVIAVCSSIPSVPSNGVRFKITSILSNATFQWMIRDLGSSSWLNVGDGDEYLYKVLGAGPHSSFEIKCKVTLPTGATGFSNSMQVIFEY